MKIKTRVSQIEKKLLNKQLVYFGTRGTDAESLLKINNFSNVFSQIAPLSAGTISEISLETEMQERVELDEYNIDIESSEEKFKALNLREKLLKVFDQPSAIIPYRPCAFLSSVLFPRLDRVRYLGLFHEKQFHFEHKSWVESQLSDKGILILPWQYYTDNDKEIIREKVAFKPLVLRTNRTDGGVGVRLIERPEELENEWPSHDDGFLAVSPYLEPSIPLNINACVFRDGTVTLHGPSVQLIGLNRITNRTFGYCGNDFARITEFDVSMINNLEEITISAGLWLHSNGYLGAFGVDALFCKGKLYLTEINPRFQGSSSMSARIDKELDRPDVFIEHIAAFLDLPAPKKISLYELVKEQPPLAHIYCHNLGPDSIYCSSITTDELEIECALIPSTNIAVLQDAITFEAIFNKPVTINGMLLDNGIEEEIVSISKCLYPELKWTKKESNKQMEFKLEDY